jgi:hypothetical protein
MKGASLQIVEAFLGEDLARDCKSFVLEIERGCETVIKAEFLVFNDRQLPAITSRQWTLTETTDG